ncbi:hypothetical protein EHQ12_15540 [Leptospira gomenensis]|uniref:Type II secretion system protein M n=1 Tax=Leptospira gomenensis TaxID=2484974 RepID=A0A5F1YMT9_9LEPT|nr:hypothetical protein [Leptospira gomenensis]TGK35014.1 hypothetical protein EHQ12_15540 [Leptospira gomenensis]TGK35308.1 hypothetical protein EHQ17_07685 [Leptospira gomenensis]TGK51793.1 hypothetical protein EHQ07_02185 [Leptospira gomenensis]TGK58388.1 hypothetical protein EHQ13_14090 [Leptospira gomenensis]
MLEKLEPRERLLVLGGIGLILLLILFLAVRKVVTLRQGLSERVQDSRTAPVKLDKIIQEFNDFRSLDSTGGETDVSALYAKLDEIFVKYGLKEKISTMKDSNAVEDKKYNRITIDINFRSVTLDNIVRLIYDIEKNKMVNARVEYLNFRKPFQGKEVYDVNLKLSTYSRLTGAKR